MMIRRFQSSIVHYESMLISRYESSIIIATQINEEPTLPIITRASKIVNQINTAIAKNTTGVLSCIFSLSLSSPPSLFVYFSLSS